MSDGIVTRSHLDPNHNVRITPSQATSPTSYKTAQKSEAVFLHLQAVDFAFLKTPFAHGRGSHRVEEGVYESNEPCAPTHATLAP